MLTNLKYFALMLLLAPAFVSCDEVRGSGNVSKEEHDLSKFSVVEASGSMDVYITKGNASHATIEAEDNILPLIELIEENGRLEVRFKRNVRVNTRKQVKVFLTTAQLEAASLSGSGDLEIESHFETPVPVHLSLSGSGNLNASFTAPELNIDLAGSGNLKIKGDTRDLKLNLAGSGDAHLEDLKTETADLDIAGSGDVDLHASRTLKANIVGSGDVNYKGNPTVTVNKIGSGSVKKQ
ncbi:head GIN domain-containing protein [Chitinophaga niabensis]|uniref:head GIN domain-containing protein n=1 Tax=Chitinophaga niabensis TaxID=536979 RepID=UPI0031BB19E0